MRIEVMGFYMKPAFQAYDCILPWQNCSMHVQRAYRSIQSLPLECDHRNGRHHQSCLFRIEFSLVLHNNGHEGHELHFASVAATLHEGRRFLPHRPHRLRRLDGIRVGQPHLQHASIRGICGSQNVFDGAFTRAVGIRRCCRYQCQCELN